MLLLINFYKQFSIFFEFLFKLLLKRVVFFMNKIFLKVFCLLCLSLIAISSLKSNVSVFAESEFNVNAKASILIDFNSGEILVENNADEKLEIASMVKLMTVYLTLQAIENQEISLSDNLVASPYAASMGGSQVFLDANNSYNIEKMLQSVIMASANDASVALAEHISGSEKEFVNKMNQTAEKLGMTNTLYANATGLPAPMQHSSAKDTAVILSKLVNNETYHKYSCMWMDKLVHPSGRTTEIVNTNKLSRYYEGCDSGKTGFTDEAGYCLAVSAKRNDMRLISVVIGTKSSKERFSESVSLLNYGFASFKNQQIISSDDAVSYINITKSKTKTAKVFAKEDFYALTKKGTQHNYTYSLEIPKAISAPIVSGSEVGKIIISKNGEVVKEIPLVIKEDIKAYSFFEALEGVLEKW